MSYRTKTCAYCNGNHAILDCTKLPADAKKAQEKLDLIASDTQAWLKEAVHAHASAAFYYELNCKSDPNGNGYIVEYDGSTQTKKDLAERTVATVAWRLTEHFATREEAREAVDPDVFDTFPTNVTYEERWNGRDADREYRPSSYRQIIRRNNEVQEAVSKRAKKSCSYCRGEGHTVRTCTQKKTDVETYHDAFKVAMYLQARALSRFGLWTSSLVKRGDSYYTFSRYPTTPFFLDQIPSDPSDKISTEDLTDCLYIMAVGERSSFTKMGSEGSYYNNSTRLGFEVSQDYLKFFDLKNNRVDFSAREEDDRSSTAELFLPTVIDTEHIFKQLMENYKEPAPKKDRYASQNEIGLGDCRNLWDSDHSWRRNIWVQNRELYDRKKRNSHIFEQMTKFVATHSDILEKANGILNKS